MEIYSNGIFSIPSREILKTIFRSHRRVVIVFGRIGLVRRNLVFLLLKFKMGKSYVITTFSLHGGNEIRYSIEKLLTFDKILSLFPLIRKAAFDYTDLSLVLSIELGKSFCVDISEIHRHRIENKLTEGVLGNWKCFFHGTGITYERTGTGVQVNTEICFPYGPQGINTGFLLQFIESAVEYKSLASELVNGYSDLIQVKSALANQYKEISDYYNENFVTHFV